MRSQELLLSSTCWQVAVLLQMLLKQILVLPLQGAVCIITGDLTALRYCLQVAEDIDGKEHIMREYKGKVLLITNVASECGYTESQLQRAAAAVWQIPRSGTGGTAPPRPCIMPMGATAHTFACDLMASHEVAL